MTLRHRRVDAYGWLIGDILIGVVKPGQIVPAGWTQTTPGSLTVWKTCDGTEQADGIHPRIIGYSFSAIGKVRT